MPETKTQKTWRKNPETGTWEKVDVQVVVTKRAVKTDDEPAVSNTVAEPVDDLPVGQTLTFSDDDLNVDTSPLGDEQDEFGSSNPDDI